VHEQTHTHIKHTDTTHKHSPSHIHTHAHANTRTHTHTTTAGLDTGERPQKKPITPPLGHAALPRTDNLYSHLTYRPISEVEQQVYSKVCCVCCVILTQTQVYLFYRCVCVCVRVSMSVDVRGCKAEEGVGGKQKEDRSERFVLRNLDTLG